MKTQVNLKFYLPELYHEYPIIRSRPWNSKFESHIRLNRREEVDPTVMNFLKQSYDMS